MKKLLSGLLLATSIATLTSCGGGGGGSNEPTSEFTSITTESEAKTVATLYHSLVNDFVFPLVGYEGVNTSSVREVPTTAPMNAVLLMNEKVLKPIGKTETTTINCDYGGTIYANLNKDNNGVTRGTFEFRNCQTEYFVLDGNAEIEWTDANNNEKYEIAKTVFKQGFIAVKVGSPTDETLTWENDWEYTMEGDLNGEMTMDPEDDRFNLLLDGGPIKYTNNEGQVEEVSFDKFYFWLNTHDPMKGDIEFTFHGKISISNNACTPQTYNLKFKNLAAIYYYFPDTCPFDGKVDINDGQVEMEFYSPDANEHDPNNVKIKLNGNIVYDDRCDGLENEQGICVF